MECTRCRRSVNDHSIILHRTTPFGEDGKFMCESCLKKEEPELLKNIKSDDSYKILNAIRLKKISFTFTEKMTYG